MSDSVSDFLDSLGAAFGETNLEAPAEAVVATEPGPGQTTADQAMTQIASAFQQLQLVAGRITKAFGADVPCAVVNQHGAAAAAYMAIAAQVFGELAGQGYVVMQKIYDQSGKLIRDQPGAVAVSPVTFAPCKPLNGFGRAVLNIGVISKNLAAAARIAPRVLSSTATHAIVVHWPSDAFARLQAQVSALDAYLGCIEHAIQGSPNADRAQLDATCRPSPVPPDGGVSSHLAAYLAVASIGLVGAALLYWALSGEGEDEGLPVAELEPVPPQSATHGFGDGATHAGVPARFKGCICF